MAKRAKSRPRRSRAATQLPKVVSGELVTLLQIAMMGGLHYSALRDGIFSHPTLAESLNNLFTAMDRAAQAM